MNQEKIKRKILVGACFECLTCYESCNNYYYYYIPKLQISDIGSISLTLLFFSIIATGLLEMRWSDVGAQEWWRSQQFWVIGGVSSHLFAVIYGPMKILMGKKANLSVLTEKSIENDLKELYAFRWTALLILPTTIILINLCAMVSGISSAINSGYGSWGLLLVKLFFSCLVIIHLYPFLKGLVVRHCH